MQPMNRRALLTGLISLVAAPAIVRVSSIMPVKVMPPLFFGRVTGIDWSPGMKVEVNQLVRFGKYWHRCISQTIACVDEDVWSVFDPRIHHVED